MDNPNYKGVDLEINNQLKKLLAISESNLFAIKIFNAMGLPITKEIKVNSLKEMISLSKPILELVSSQISKLENLEENIVIAADLEKSIETMEQQLKELENEES